MKTKALNLTLSLLFVSLCLWAQKPRAEFTYNATNGCAPIIVNFQDKSSGNPTSWQWDFGNGSSSSKQNPSTSYFKAGNYTVKLKVTNASGADSVIRTGLISVYDGPTVDFIADKTTSCAPGRIQFSDQSTPSPDTKNTTWLWDFGDGTISTEQNPLHIYRSTGQFTVFLKVTNDKGCSKMLSKPNFVTITPGITSNFSSTFATFCRAPATINFANSSQGPGTLSYTWLFGDGDTARTENPSHIYKKDSTYPVTLIVKSTEGCFDTLTKPNTIKVGGIKSDFTFADTLCNTTNITFKNTSFPAPVSSQWLFPDNSSSNELNAVKSFATAGTYTVKLINQYENCRDSVHKTIKISAKPVISFTSADSVHCKIPARVTFQNKTNAAVSYLWVLGNGDSSTTANPSLTYTKEGNYNVKLVATNTAGCTDSLSKPSFIRIKKPVITFKNLPARGCLPYTLTPIAEVDTADKIISYQWNFGDGGRASGKSPSYTYTRLGTYSVTLTITTSTGCTETLTLDNAVRVGTKPRADFTANVTEVCASQPIQFINKSSEPADEYFWYFGDGGHSRSKDPSYTFVDTGKLWVSLVVFNSGCGDTLGRGDFVHIKPPIAKFSIWRPNCDNRLQHTFTDVSKGAETWKWDFENGKRIVEGQTYVEHTFPQRGEYPVSLTVKNGACSYTYTETIRIYDQTPDFTASSLVGCKEFTPTFSYISAAQVKNVYWNFGDGATSGDGQPKHTYKSTGSYSVQLITTDIYNCLDYRTKDNFIKVTGPTAAFESLTNKGCKGLTTTFADSSKPDGTNAIVSWQWYFGDGKGKSTLRSPSYKYDATGNFHVKLVVKDAGGCMDSLTRNDFVQISTIKADWDAITESCPTAPVTFNNKTGGMYANTWSFGDSTFSNEYAPTHAYADTGYYTIKLKVRDAAGCEDSLTRNRYLRIARPVADFTANNLTSYCTPFEAKFTNTSQYYTSYMWSFQGGTSIAQAPVSYYTQTGEDTIKLVVTSPGGCTDAVSKVLRVKNALEGKVTYNPLIACTPAEINFEAFEPINAKFTWDFGDGTLIDTSANKLTYTYKDFGKFLPKVIMEEQCIIPLVGLDTIYIYGVDARFGLDKKLFCDSGTVAFLDSTVYNTPITGYKWSFGDGETSSMSSPTHFFKQPGNYNIRLDVTTEAGCEDSAIFSKVKVVQSPRIAITGDTVICANERIRYAGHFTRSDTSAVRWQWEFPNRNVSFAQNPELQLFQVAGSYQVRTLVTNSSGCKDSAFLPLQVFSLPTVTVPPALTTYTGASATIPATYSTDVVNYSWKPAQGLSCIDCPQPIATPKFTTKYNITVTNENGCRNTGDILMNVQCPTTNIFIPNTFSPNGDGRNDIFYVRGKGIERVKSLRVFNRWGEIVFEKREIPVNVESVQYGWNGRNKNGNPHPDVYIYQVEVYCENGEVLRFEGNVALIQ